MKRNRRVSGYGLASSWSVSGTIGTLMHTAKRLAIAGLLVATSCPPAWAQQLANSFDQLSVLVKPGDVVTVMDDAGRETRGAVAALSPSSLELSVAGNRRSFLEDEARTIRLRRSDSLKNGALWGLVIGAGLGLTTFIEAEGSPTLAASEATAGTFILGGLGTAIGVGVDAIFRSNDVIYSRSPRTSARLRLSPMLSRGRAGALLALGF